MSARRLYRRLRQIDLLGRFRTSADYWERRYRAGLDSGDGSHGELADFKRQFLNDFLSRNAVETVIDLGCGDGVQIEGVAFPSYLGLDIAPRAIQMCQERYRTDSAKAFLLIPPTDSARLELFLSADLTVSLDVIYHLVEEETFERHLAMLFGMSRRHVIVYSSDSPVVSTLPHVRHREFTSRVASLFPEFELRTRVGNPFPDVSAAEFFVFERT